MGFLTERDLEASAEGGAALPAGSSAVGGAALPAGSSRSVGGGAAAPPAGPSPSSSALARRCEFVRAAARLCS